MSLKETLYRILGHKNEFHPTGGEVFQALKDVEIKYLSHFMAPYTGGGKGRLLKGERVIINRPKDKRPSHYYCEATNNAELEERVVTQEERDDPAYNGFTLFFDSTILNKNFKQVKLTPIQYVKGDATAPVSNKPKIIAHICNDVGGWGKGFVMAISNKWKQPEIEYRKWFKEKEGDETTTIHFEKIEGGRDRYSNEKEFKGGNVQFVKVADDIWVANMIAQHDVVPNSDGLPPIRYAYVSDCLERARQFARKLNAGVHMPRIGCGLAGGKWEEIEPLINHFLIAHEIDTTVYDLQ